MARYKIECCYNCADRHPCCHSSCERYKQERAEYDETIAAQKREADIQKGLKSAAYDYNYKVNKRIVYRSKYRGWH